MSAIGVENIWQIMNVFFLKQSNQPNMFTSAWSRLNIEKNREKEKGQPWHDRTPAHRDIDGRHSLANIQPY
jgi:hypothetical protein